jgi:hypothetical protein
MAPIVPRRREHDRSAEGSRGSPPASTLWPYGTARWAAKLVSRRVMEILLSFPSSAWERTSVKLCLAQWGSGASQTVRSQAELGNEVSSASPNGEAGLPKRSVPKRSLGTRLNEVKRSLGTRLNEVKRSLGTRLNEVKRSLGARLSRQPKRRHARENGLASERPFLHNSRRSPRQ